MTSPRPPANDRDIGRDLEFWAWLRASGLRTLLDGWLALHLLVGLALSVLVSDTLRTIAQAVFLPFASVLVGLAFAWGGNAMAVLQSQELHEIGNQPGNPSAYRDWVFSYQLAILVITVVLIVWGLAALGLADGAALLVPGSARNWSKIAGRTAAFALSSLAIRESWNVVLGAQAMLLAQSTLRREKETDRSQQ